MKKSSKRLLLALTASAAVAVPLALLGIPYLSAFLRLCLAAGCLLLLLWMLWRAYRSFLWKVGRRLAFSYFLLGVLPIPMLLLILVVVGYFLAGFFLGHLYRDAVGSLQADLETGARMRAEAFAASGRVPRGEEVPGMAFTYYRNGRRVAGDPRGPAQWPAWTEPGEQPGAGGREAAARFFANEGSPTLAAFVAREGRGVVALYTGDVNLEISRRSELWVETYRSDDPDLDVISLELSGRKIPLQRLRKDRRALEAEKFFKKQSLGERFWDSPVLWWGEISGPLVDPATGRVLAEYVAANLNGTPRTVLRHLFASAAEIDTLAWGVLLVVAFLLFDIYMAAALMAVFMIVSLSRAVNLLSWATAAVRQGDFRVRIPVRRRDQLGDLQRSFNEMAANLETSVAAAAQKEVLEKELDLARDLQKSLIPGDLPVGDGIEFATLFEPSAAIGGDYFDVLRLSDRDIAIIIADVSGHGLSTGLRMAMLKAALLILMEETRDPEEVLGRLDSVVRADREKRVFVTATLGLLDRTTGKLRLTNAGHPPTYRVRGRRVDEIVLPSSPLGGLGKSYGRAELALEPGDLVVWLSDGLIEATNAADETFGYQRVLDVLGRAAGESATELRDRLLAAVAAHTQRHPPSDDRTLVVMRYKA